MKPQRITILGQPGSGKSTLARALGAQFDLPVFHMDKIHYKPGWVERSAEEKLPLTLEVIAKPAWVFEGGFSRTWPHRLRRSDLAIWLDLPVGLRLWRVLRRSWRYRGQVRPDLAEGCPEVFGRQTLEFIRFIWRTRRRGRDKIRRTLAETAPDLPLYHLTSQADIDGFQASLAAGHWPPARTAPEFSSPLAAQNGRGSEP